MWLFVVLFVLCVVVLCFCFFFCQGTLSRSYRKKIEKSRENGDSLTPLLDQRSTTNPSHVETYVVPPPSFDGLAGWREVQLRKKGSRRSNMAAVGAAAGAAAGAAGEHWDTFPEEMRTQWFGPVRPHEYLVNGGSSIHAARTRQVMNHIRLKQTRRKQVAMVMVEKEEDDDGGGRGGGVGLTGDEAGAATAELQSFGSGSGLPPTGGSSKRTTRSVKSPEQPGNGHYSRRSPLNSMDAMDPTQAAAVLMVGVVPVDGTTLSDGRQHGDWSIRHSSASSSSSSSAPRASTSSSENYIHVVDFIRSIVDQMIVTARLEGSRRVMLRKKNNFLICLCSCLNVCLDSTVESHL